MTVDALPPQTLVEHSRLAIRTDRPLTSDLDTYRDQALPIELLTAEQEQYLGDRIKEGDLAAHAKVALNALHNVAGGTEPVFTEELDICISNGDRAVKDFVAANLKIVLNLADKIKHRVPAHAYMDVIQDGNELLTKLVKTFNPKFGFRFSTYAFEPIERRVRRAAAAYSRRSVISLPRYKVDEYHNVGRVTAELTQELKGQVPSIGVIADRACVAVETVVDYSRPENDAMASLDAPTSNGSTLNESAQVGTVSAEDEFMDNDWDPADFIRCAGLTDHERKIMIELFTPDEKGVFPTLDTVGKRHGVTRQAVSLTRINACKKLKAYMTSKQS